MSYKQVLPTIDELRAKYPKEMAELDACVLSKDIEEFGAIARGHTDSDAYTQVSRYADIRYVQSLANGPADLGVDQYVEDCVAERVRQATWSVGKIDEKTKRLIGQHGYLRGMVEQLKPLTKVGEGNFKKLRDGGLADCTAEYCVWKWGRDIADQKLLDKLDGIASQHNFK